MMERHVRTIVREKGPGREMMMRELGLSDAQRDKMADIRDRQQRKGIQARADIALAELDLRKLMRAENPDGRAIDAQIDRLAALRAGLHKARVAAMLERRAVLTPEQRKKLREMGPPGRMREGMGGMREGMRGMREDGEERGEHEGER